MTNPEIVKVNLSRQKPDFSYEIVIGRDLFPQIADYLKSANLASKYAIITDTNVQKHLHPARLYSALNQKGLESEVFVFEAGEENKTVATWDRISNDIARAGFGRDSSIIALGGGVVGDLAGFIAATFDRGVPYIQVPTTVLAQADSSVGGKVAVDTPHGKNRRGAFYHPKRVFIDIDTLRTLPYAEYANGLAETVKHAIIEDRDYLFYIQENLNLIDSRDPEIFLELAKANCSIKANIVEQDPNEKGPRRKLNYGHTVGHAIEKLSDYKIHHGHAVSIGMMVAARISRNLEYMESKEIAMQEKLLRNLGLPVNIPKEMTADEIIKQTLTDKKAAKGKARYCLPKEVGTMLSFNGQYVTEVPEEVVRSALQETGAD
jgi:3-dehydroquinate synthase